MTEFRMRGFTLLETLLVLTLVGVFSPSGLPLSMHAICKEANVRPFKPHCRSNCCNRNSTVHGVGAMPP